MLSTSITNPRAPGNGPGWTDQGNRVKKSVT